MPRPVSLTALAAASAAPTRPEGRCRGSLLLGWAANLDRRWGPGTAEQLRREAGVAAASLPDAPAPEAWLPAWTQLAVTRWLLHKRLDGDPCALIRLFTEDAARDGGVASRALAKAGPGVMYRAAGLLHPHVYDVGRARGSVSRDQVSVHFSGAPLIADPTWRIIQWVANDLGVRAMGWSQARLEGVDDDNGGFELVIRR
jgi:hypothetical protein